MSYATLDEVWGPDFSNHKRKKSKKEKKLEKIEKKMLEESIDPQLVIPRMADSRESYNETTPKNLGFNDLDG